MSEARQLTKAELQDWLRIEQTDGRRIVDPERHDEPDDPDEWMPDWKPRGDTGVPSIPPDEEP